jgi:hypothetical protein
MRKTLPALLIVLAIALGACSGTTGSTTATQAASQVQSSSGDSAAVALSTSYDNALPVASQLLLGTFKLEGTNQAVTAAQAAVLLPLWTEYSNLSQSMGPGSGQTGTTSDNTDVQAQIDTLVAQIQAAMTSDQIQAIANLQLTSNSAQTILSDLGITMGGPGQDAGGQQPPAMSGGNGQQPRGAPPAGSPPSGGQQPQGTPQAGAGQAPQDMPPALPGDAQPSDNGQMPNAQAGGPGFGFGFPPEVTTALIQLLQERSGVPTTAANEAASNAAPSGAPGGQSSSTSVTLSGAYTLGSGSTTLDGQTFAASNDDEAAVYVTGSGALTLTNATITTSGDTSSQDSSSFYGLNAAVLAADGGTIDLSDSTVTTTGTGANGVFATGDGSAVNLSNVTIQASADGAHAVMATNGGSMTLSNVDMTTAGGSSSAIATDRGGGTITVTGGTVTASGMNSAGIYSTGDISVKGGTFNITGAEAAVIEGANSITLTDTDLTSTKSGKWGVMIYQSMSGDAEGTQGTYAMTGGSLTYTATDGPLFYVTNSTGVITLKGVSLTAASGTLIKAAAGNWGNSGANGGTVVLTADGQVLTGSLMADSLSSITATLQNGSSLTGAVNADNTAEAVSLSLDAASTWTVTADSYLTVLTDAAGVSGSAITNIIGNGHTVYYDATNGANSTLGGQTYSLVNGGQLTPMK